MPLDRESCQGHSVTHWLEIGQRLSEDPTMSCCPHCCRRSCNSKAQEHAHQAGQAQRRQSSSTNENTWSYDREELRYPTSTLCAEKEPAQVEGEGQLAFRPKFRMTYKELLAMPGMADKLRFPPKYDRNLESRKEFWCKFHKAFGHNVEHCIALGY